MYLATLALEVSQLGKTLKYIRKDGISLTMYVDDILISGPNLATLSRAHQNIIEAAAISKYPLAAEKCSRPSTTISAFNIEQNEQDMWITDKRFQRFIEDYAHGTDEKREALRRYVAVVNLSQVTILEAI